MPHCGLYAKNGATPIPRPVKHRAPALVAGSARATPGIWNYPHPYPNSPFLPCGAPNPRSAPANAHKDLGQLSGGESTSASSCSPKTPPAACSNSVLKNESVDRWLLIATQTKPCPGPSLVTQSLHRIEPRGAAGREVHRGQTSHTQRHGHGHKRQRIVWRHQEHSLHQPADGESRRQP